MQNSVWIFKKTFFPFFKKNYLIIDFFSFNNGFWKEIAQGVRFFFWKYSYLILKWCNQCLNFKSMCEHIFEKTKHFKTLLIFTRFWVVISDFFTSNFGHMSRKRNTKKNHNCFMQSFWARGDFKKRNELCTILILNSESSIWH